LKKKLLSITLVLCLAIALAVPALAAGTAVINDNDGNNGTINGGNGTNTIPGGAVIDDKTVANVYGVGGTSTAPNMAVADRGASANLTNANGQDIDVNARIHEADAAVRYVVDIYWGDMKFVYNRTGQVWNPTTHKYIVPPGAAGSWLANNATIVAGGTATESYIDGINNRIVVVNHSNAAVTPTFTYAANGATFGTTVPTGTFPVAGGFYALNGAAATDANSALAAAALTGDPTGLTAFNVFGKQQVGATPLVLLTADGRDPAKVTGTTVANIVIGAGADFATEAFFAFTGTPGTDAAAGLKDLTNFTKVGTITVTITPNNATANNTKGSDTY